MPRYDRVIANGIIVDGTRAPRYRGDIAIKDGRIAKIGRKALPEAMRKWSEPLPPEQWAKPSAELLRLSAKVKALVKRSPRRAITEIFAEVNRP